jgi:hypothetical protein
LPGTFSCRYLSAAKVTFLMAYPNNMAAELLGRADADIAVHPPLPQAVGYTVVVVIGLVIAFAMVFVTKVLRRTVGEDNRKTEM